MLSDFYFPVLGGVEQHVRTLSTALQQRGHEISVATLGQPDLLVQEVVDGVRVHRLSSTTQKIPALYRHAHRPWAPPCPDPHVMSALRRVISEERPDVVHGHDWIARSYAPLAPFGDAAFVSSLHYYTITCARKDLMRLGETPCEGPGLRKCLECGGEHYGRAKGTVTVLGNFAGAVADRRVVDRFIAVSLATADGNGLDGQRVPYDVIPNFVPDTAGEDVELDADTAALLRQLPDDPFLLFVGDLRRLKGIDVLLDAYGRLVDAPPLVCIGKVWPETPEDLPPNVRVLKNWPNKAVLAAWRRSLLGVVPSIWPEPFGIVAIEAMACGRPVVASRTGGLPDVVVDGESGILVPPGDAEALATALQRLIDDRPLLERMGTAARRHAETFRVAAVVPRIERAYDQALARTTHRGRPTEPNRRRTP